MVVTLWGALLANRLTRIRHSPEGVIMEPTTKTAKPAKRLSVTIIILGVLMFIVGCVAYGIVSLELSSQGITVAAVTRDDPGPLAGKPVNGPFEALAQINAIQAHTQQRTGGKTYAQLGNVATTDGKTYSTDVSAASSTDGQAHKAGDALSAEDAATYQARATAQTASFLQASLFLSVLAFGVSVFVALMGVIVCLIGITLNSIAKRLPAPQAAPPAVASS